MESNLKTPHHGFCIYAAASVTRDSAQSSMSSRYKGRWVVYRKEPSGITWILDSITEPREFDAAGEAAAHAELCARRVIDEVTGTIALAA
ncbi:MAG: hypothetical protein ACRYG5_12990 [Janthinobacterium lividum]